MRRLAIGAVTTALLTVVALVTWKRMHDSQTSTDEPHPPTASSAKAAIAPPTQATPVGMEPSKHTPTLDVAPTDPCEKVIAALRNSVERVTANTLRWTDAAVSKLMECLYIVESELDIELLLNAARTSSPANPQAVEDLASLYQSQKRFPEAIALFEAALASGGPPQFHQRLAYMIMNRAIQASVSSEEEYYSLLQTAEQHLLRFAEADPEQAVSAYQEAAKSMLFRHDYLQGAQTLERALNALKAKVDQPPPGDKLAYLYVEIGEAYIKTRQLQTGAAYLDYAVALPESAEFREKISVLRDEIQARSR